MICCSWWCVDKEEIKEVTSDHRSSPIKVHCDSSTYYLIEPSSFTIAYVDPHIAAKRGGENNTQLFSWHRPGDDGSRLPIDTSIIDRTILSIMNGAIPGQRDPSQKIRVLWGCQKKPNGGGGPHSHNATPIFDTNTAAGWLQLVMKLNIPTHFCIIYCGQQADGTSGSKMPMRDGCRYLPLNDILPPTAEDMIDTIREESDGDAQMQRPHRRSFPMINTGFQNFERKLQMRFIGQQQYIEVVRKRAFVTLSITSKLSLLMRTWFGYTNMITLWILPLWALWQIGSVKSAIRLHISHSEDEMHCMVDCSKICIEGGYFSATLEGGRMGDNLELFGQVLGLFLVFCLF